MFKREITEIKKQLTMANCSISQVAGCMVTGEKKITLSFSGSLLNMTEDSVMHYMDIFRKVLTGKTGKVLWDVPFTRAAEESGGHVNLMELRSSKLQDDGCLEEFYQKIVDTYDTTEPYTILLASMQYDVPGKTSDDNPGDSEEVFDCILCATLSIGDTLVEQVIDAEDRGTVSRML